MQTISISREKLTFSSTDNKIRSLFNLFILAVSVFFVNRILFERKKISLQRPFVERNTSTSSLPHLFQYFFNSSQHTRHTRFLVLTTTKLAFFEGSSIEDESFFLFFFFFAFFSKLFGPYTS